MFCITKAFESLEKEKQEIILRAAFEEFASSGYKKASTNRIVKTAGIGKGMLFYYFGSKQELFIDLIDYSAGFIKKYWGTLVSEKTPTDIIGSLQAAVEVKMKAMLENPPLFDFLTRLFLHADDEYMPDGSKEHFDHIMELRVHYMNGLFASPDTSLLRSDLSPEKCVKYLNWTVEGYAQYVITSLGVLSQEKLSNTDLDPYWKEFDELMNDLKRLFYKPEAL